MQVRPGGPRTGEITLPQVGLSLPGVLPPRRGPHTPVDVPLRSLVRPQLVLAVRRAPGSRPRGTGCRLCAQRRIVPRLPPTPAARRRPGPAHRGAADRPRPRRRVRERDHLHPVRTRRAHRCVHRESLPRVTGLLALRGQGPPRQHRRIQPPPGRRAFPRVTQRRLPGPGGRGRRPNHRPASSHPTRPRQRHVVRIRHGRQSRCRHRSPRRGGATLRTGRIGGPAHDQGRGGHDVPHGRSTPSRPTPTARARVGYVARPACRLYGVSSTSRRSAILGASGRKQGDQAPSSGLTRAPICHTHMPETPTGSGEVGAQAPHQRSVDASGPGDTTPGSSTATKGRRSLRTRRRLRPYCGARKTVSEPEVTCWWWRSRRLFPRGRRGAPSTASTCRGRSRGSSRGPCRRRRPCRRGRSCPTRCWSHG